MQQLQGQTLACLLAPVLLRTINIRCIQVIRQSPPLHRRCGLFRHSCRRLQAASPLKRNTGCRAPSTASGGHSTRTAFPIHFRYSVDIPPHDRRHQCRFASRKQCGRQDQRRDNQRVFHTGCRLPWEHQPHDRITNSPPIMFGNTHKAPVKSAGGRTLWLRPHTALHQK